MGKFPGGTLYFSEVYRALVYAGGEVGRAGIGEYLGHGQPLFVFRQDVYKRQEERRLEPRLVCIAKSIGSLSRTNRIK